MPPKKPKPAHVETRGRNPIPEPLRRVTLACRVPKRVLDGYDKRARAAGHDAQGRARSSRGLEIERAYDATAGGK